MRRLLDAVSAEEDDPDAPLVVRMAAGDERALGELIRRHGPRLRALALRFSGNAGGADDIVQETFWAAWRSASRWTPGEIAFKAYLTRIAVNRAIDGERRLRLRRFFGLDVAADAVEPTPSAESSVAARNELAAVVRDIGALPAKQRAAILLSAGGERTNREIADALGLSEGAAEQLLVRARRTLRLRLAERDQKEKRE